MKRTGYLYEKVMTLENIRAAWDLYNANRPSWLRVEYDERIAEWILAEMERDFAGCIGSPRIRWYCDKGKWRMLEIPGTFRSSVAQIALWNVCGPYVERRIHDNSFSSRKGKGSHFAAKKVERFVRTKGGKEARYCFYFDISKYYAHIDKRIVMDRLSTIFKDRRIMELFRIVVYSTPRGLPIGYPFSHALANLYAAPLYHLARATKGVTAMFVYMDNHNVFATSKAALRRFRKVAARWLAGVGCAIKGDWQIFPTGRRAVKMCGLAFASGGRRRLYHSLWHRTMRNFDRLVKHFKLSDYLGMQSRLGWLDLCGMRFCEALKYEGGYLWR